LYCATSTLAGKRGLISLAVILGLTLDADCETDAHCDVVIFNLLCDKQVVDCLVATLYQLAVPSDREQIVTRRQFSSSHASLKIVIR